MVAPDPQLALDATQGAFERAFARWRRLSKQEWAGAVESAAALATRLGKKQETSLPAGHLMRLIDVMQIQPRDALRWDVMEKPTAGELYEEHAARALRFAYLLCGDPDVAHDLVQDAFVKLLSRPRLLIRPAAFESYLRTTIVNLSRSRWRRVALERRHRSTHGPTNSEVTSSYEERDEVRKALRDLPERQRAAVVLRYFEDLSEQQTAETMNTSVAAVKSLVQRAMVTLRRDTEGSRDG